MNHQGIISFMLLQYNIIGIKQKNIVCAFLLFDTNIKKEPMVAFFFM
jgi:hypothetical protein